MAANIAKQINAAGTANLKLTRNLSFMCAPWLRVEAMVVSEIIDKLQPAITLASISADSTKPKAIGAIAAMVPIEVPIAVARNADTKKSPGNKK